MRLDYALYGLAIVLFATTAITFALIADQDGKILYSISTTVVGLLSVVGGYLLRPKVNGSSVQAPISAPQGPTSEEFKQTETTVAESPKAEASIPEAPPAKSTPIVEVSKVDTSIAEAPVTSLVKKEPRSSSQIATPAAENSQVLVAIAPPSGEASIQTGPETAKSEFTRIRGISEKRAGQLKANGINTIGDLANASAEDLAVKLDVSPKIVKMWIGSAKKVSK